MNFTFIQEPINLVIHARKPELDRPILILSTKTPSGKPKKFTCTCGKSFVQHSSLTTHMRIHSGEKPYHCKVCDKRYGDLSTYTKHKRIHTGDKPYSCLFCRRKFSQSGNCLRHTRAVHLTGNKAKQLETIQLQIQLQGQSMSPQDLRRLEMQQQQLIQMIIADSRSPSTKSNISNTSAGC